MGTPLLGISKKYKIQYRDNFGSVKQDVYITGTTDYNSMGKFSEYDIRSEVFTKNNIEDIQTYLDYVVGSIIYIGFLIKSKNPIEYEKEALLIPESVLNPYKIQEYYECDQYAYTINGIVRHFNSAVDRSDFSSRSVSEIKSILPVYGDLFFAENIPNTSIGSTKILKDKDEILASILYKTDKMSEKIAADNAKRIESERLKNFYEKELKRMRELERNLEGIGTQYDEALAEVATTQAELFTANQTQLRVRSIMSQMISDIQLTNPEFPSFDTLYTQAENELYP